MLVLTVRLNGIVDLYDAAGERIEVSVVEIRGNKVRLGFEADREKVKIWRRELHVENPVVKVEKRP